MVQFEKWVFQQHSIRIASDFYGEQKVRFLLILNLKILNVTIVIVTEYLCWKIKIASCYDAHTMKTLPQAPFEGFAVYITQHNFVLVLPIFKTLNTHTQTVCQQNSMAQLSTEQLALQPCPVPDPISPSHTHIKGFVGTSSNMTPDWKCNRKHNILVSLLSTEPNALHQTSLQRDPRLSNKEQSGARFKGTLSLVVSWNAQTNTTRRGCCFTKVQQTKYTSIWRNID